MAVRSAGLGADCGAATAARTENQTETTPKSLSIFARIAHDVLGCPTSCRQIDCRTDETKRVRPLRNFRLKHRSLLMSRVGHDWPRSSTWLQACPMVWECPREGRTYRSYEIGIAKAFFVGYASVACRRLYAGWRRTLLLAFSAFMSGLALRRSFSTAQMASRRTGQRERTDSGHCYPLCATNRSAADWGQRRVTQFWVGSLWSTSRKFG